MSRPIAVRHLLVRTDRLIRSLALPPLIAAAIGLIGCRDTPRPAAGDSASTARPAAPASSVPTPAARGDTIPISVVAIVDGTSYQAEGKGACESAADGSIYGIPASLWRASFTAPDTAGLRHLTLTVWQPKRGGAPLVTLSLQIDARTHQIATVAGGKSAGKASAKIEPNGERATLTIDGTTGDGTPLKIAVACARVSAVVPEGG